MGLRSGPVCTGQSSSSTQNPPNCAFLVIALCSVVQSCWNRKGSSLYYLYNTGGVQLSRISWYAEVLSWNKLSLLHQTLELAQCSQTGTILLAFAKFWLIHQSVRWKSWFATPQNMFPLLQCPVVACFTPLHPENGIVQLIGHARKLLVHSFVMILMPEKVWNSKKLISQQGINHFYALFASLLRHPTLYPFLFVKADCT